ncbi:MAG: hypothetical protein SFV21_05140 [Rhodospirillaceae bacterium]|nr:hypothetical protein [Rhodospirillaceae bacterium]
MTGSNNAVRCVGLPGLLAAAVLAFSAGGALAQVPAGPVALTPSRDTVLTAPQPAGSGIAVGALAEPGVDRIGLLDESAGGLPASMWSGSEPELVRYALAGLPRRVPSQAMRDLARRLLLPAADPPRPPDAPFAGLGAMGAPPIADAAGLPVAAAADPAADLFDARVKALAAMGAWSDAVALIELAPLNRRTPALNKIRVDALLVDGATDAACSEAQAALAGSTETYWQEVQVFCQFAAGQTSAAQLGLSLLREQGVQDEAFFWAADLLQGERPLTPNGLRTLEPVVLAMLRQAARPLPDTVARHGDPTVLAVAAGYTEAAPTDDKLTPAELADRIRLQAEARIALAERAVNLGALDVEKLRQLYLGVDFSQDAQPPQLTQVTAADVRGRAFMFQLAAAQTVPTARAEVVARAIELARADRGARGPSLAVVGQVYAPLLAEIAAEPTLIWFSGHAARALIAAGRLDAAQPWLDLVRQMARTNIEAGEIADGLWPIEHLSQTGSQSQITPQAIRSWQAAQRGGAEARERLLNLLTAVGDPIAAADWLPALTASAKPLDVVHPPASLWHTLALAAREARVGDTAALALIAFGENDAASVSPLTLAKVVESLMVAGREAEARALAIEAALAAGL